MLKLTHVTALCAAVSLMSGASAIAAETGTMKMEMPSQMQMPMVDVAPVAVGDLEITGYWARSMLPSQPAGGGFLTVTNKGSADDRMIAAKSSKAGMMQLHEMAMDGDVMKMREKEGGIVIPAGQTVQLKPGGLHIMFMDVPEAFKAGETVDVKLTFEKAGEVDLTLPVVDMPMKK